VKFGVDGSVFFGLSPNYFQGVCGLGGEGMCVDGSVDMEELRKHYEWIDKKNEVGKEEVHIHSFFYQYWWREQVSVTRVELGDRWWQCGKEVQNTTSFFYSETLDLRSTFWY